MPIDLELAVKTAFNSSPRRTVTVELPENIYQAILEQYDIQISAGYHTLTIEEFLGALVSAGLSASIPDHIREKLKQFYGVED